MSNQDPLKNWQLENRGGNPDQWKLQDAEQDLSKHMQLQPDETADSAWQPVEYERTPRTRGRNWVLPSVVIVALLAVLGYVGWIALGQFGGAPFNLDPSQFVAGIGGTAAEPTATQTSAAVVATEPPTPEPPTPTTAPTVAPTEPPTPEPAPTVTLAELITGTVNAVGGVNARSAPATTGDVLRLLDQGLAVTALAEQDGWLQVLFDDNTTAWISAEFVDVVRQQVPLAQVNELRARAGLAPLGGEASAVPAASATEAPAVTVPITVIGQPTINARLTPALDGTVVQSLSVSTTLTAIGRTQAGDWLAVQLPDGTQAWVLGTLVAAASDASPLPVLDPASFTAASAITATTTTTETAPVAQAPAAPPILATNGVIPAAPFTNTLPATGPALTISDTAGVNVRATPGTDGAVLTVAPNGAVLAVTGRSADGAWLQVALPEGQIGWMFGEAVIASADAAAAPVADATAPAPAETPVAAEPIAPTGPTAVATVTNPLGANLRSAPNRDLDPVVAFAAGDTLTAVGRTANNEWVQLALADGTLAWALATTVEVQGGVESLTITQE